MKFEVFIVKCLWIVAPCNDTAGLWCDSWTVHLRFVVDKIALGQVFFQVLRFYPVSIIPPLVHT